MTFWRSGNRSNKAAVAASDAPGLAPGLACCEAPRRSCRSRYRHILSARCAAMADRTRPPNSLRIRSQVVSGDQSDSSASARATRGISSSHSGPIRSTASASVYFISASHSGWFSTKATASFSPVDCTCQASAPPRLASRDFARRCRNSTSLIGSTHGQCIQDSFAALSPSWPEKESASMKSCRPRRILPRATKAWKP